MKRKGPIFNGKVRDCGEVFKLAKFHSLHGVLLLKKFLIRLLLLSFYSQVGSV